MVKLDKYVDLAFRNPKGCKLWGQLQLEELQQLIDPAGELDMERVLGVIIFELGFFPKRDPWKRVQSAQWALARERGVTEDYALRGTLHMFMMIDQWLDDQVEHMEEI